MKGTERCEAWGKSGQIPPGLQVPRWDLERDLAFLDDNNIQFALLSLSAPGLSITSSPAEAKTLARACNEFAATCRDKHPDRYGFFATLPLENISDGIEELTHALDVLGADGVVLFTSYNGNYLGHEFFKPLWRELDRRAAVVFVHPTTPKDPGPPYDGMLPRPIVDFPHETTRTAVHLITSNTVRDFPNCKIILSHGGGTLPFTATRIFNSAVNAGFGGGKTADDMLVEARRFYFDLALTSFSGPLSLLVNFADEDHILWGSDYPFVRGDSVKRQRDELEELEMQPPMRSSIANGAALKLIPRLRRLVK